MSAFDELTLGIGTSSWGDSLTWGFGRGYNEQDLAEAFQQIMPRPTVFLDTAELYGLGQSETFIGKFIQQYQYMPFIATKFFPYPWRLSGLSLTNALKQSIERLGIHQIDLYQIHWDFPPVDIRTWMQALAEMKEQGLIRHLGVSNYNLQEVETAQRKLEQLGLSLASNQVKYSLLDRRIEKNGLLAQCQAMGIKIIAYSPLEQGLLTGKYTPSHLPSGIRGVKYAQKIEAIAPLINTMRDIGKAYAENSIVKTPAQVALNWCMSKGVIPIPGAKNAYQAKQNLGALGWQLSQEEIAILDRLSDDLIL